MWAVSSGKNRKGVVEIFCELRRSSDQEDLWLFMVGKTLSGELKALIDEAGLSERIVELPSVSHEDLCNIYSAAELLLFPLCRKASAGRSSRRRRAAAVWSPRQGRR